MNFDSLYAFNDAGLSVFERVLRGELDENVLDPEDLEFVEKVPGTSFFDVADFATAKEMAAAILQSLGTAKMEEEIHNIGLWAWLTFVLRDIIFPKNSEGRRKLGEVHRWYPSKMNDYQKSQRHFVRMPVLLLYSLRENADHLLCGSPTVAGEVREQLTSRQDMFHPGFQAAARNLYFDIAKHKNKSGATSKKNGGARHLARIHKQFDVTWNMYDLSAEQFIALLPKQFNRFKQQTTGLLQSVA